MRALVKHLESLDEAIVKLNIPTGIPLVYELDDSLRPVRHYYLGDPDEVAAHGFGRRARESEGLSRAACVALALAAFWPGERRRRTS